jgi:hypothetical protein
MKNLSELHWNFLNIYIFILFFLMTWLLQIFILENSFTLKILIFCMDFFILTCLGIFIGWFINIYD